MDVPAEASSWTNSSSSYLGDREEKCSNYLEYFPWSILGSFFPFQDSDPRTDTSPWIEWYQAAQGTSHNTMKSTCPAERSRHQALTGPRCYRKALGDGPRHSPWSSDEDDTNRRMFELSTYTAGL
ncbi:hypothetical protein TNCV_4358371 [Trichonephila clavipes]|nr:hypothetical protein TNCV_4358371 [Trichonephila clavipes]